MAKPRMLKSANQRLRRAIMGENVDARHLRRMLAPHSANSSYAIFMALSHCRSKSARELRLMDFQAAATASRHVVNAAARSTRCDLADVRWRWTLKVL